MQQARPRGSVRYDNTGRVVVVSGGCSGIGLSICQAFLESSASGVVCLDIDDATALPDGVTFIRCDTSDERQCHDSIGAIIKQFGALDVLVNNAAIQPQLSYVPLHELDIEVWHRMVATNLSGYTFLAKHTLQQMKQQQSGVIVNIASAQGHRTAREVGTYGPIKAANIMQARQWGVEYARHGIRIVSVSPGAIDTPLVRASLDSEGGAKELSNRHPIGRLGKPEEVAHAVLWLTGPDASFVTGTDLEVDGGLGALGSFASPYSIPKHS